MTRTITSAPRQPVAQIMQLAHQYLFNRWQAADAIKSQKKIYDAPKADKSILLSYIKDKGEADETGSYTFKFPKPVTIGTEEITGLKYRRGETPSSIDTEAVHDYARENDLEYKLSTAYFGVDGCTSGQLDEISAFIKARTSNFSVRQEWDYERLYVLNQQGEIPDDVLSAFLVKHPEDAVWSLVVVRD
jgi:hypothetical protein